MSMSASLSFYALFALIPLILLMFYLLSHLVYSSDYAIVKLAILTSNLVPDLSSNIMIEVYNASKSKVSWGVAGLGLLLWTITPLAGAMRASFNTIASTTEAPSFFKNKFKDIISVIGILLLLFLFTSAGIAIERVVRFLDTHFNTVQMTSIASVLTVMITSFLIAGFYRIFFPIRIAFSHLLLGAFVTAILWLMMRYTFGLFLVINKNYGAVFGGMKALFISITWLYLNFAVFLLGTELIATLRKKDILLLKGLFDDSRNQETYINELIKLYGKSFNQGDTIIQSGDIDKHLYFIVEGSVEITHPSQIKRTLQAGDYFGEVSLLTSQPANFNAIVASEKAQIIVIYAENIDTMLSEHPKLTMRLLKRMANRTYDN